MHLRQRLETLPQELYDEIFNLTFTHTASKKSRQTEVKTLPSGHLAAIPVFPPLLHIDQRTRAMFAKSYYGDPAGFALYGVEASEMSRWIDLLPQNHWDMLSQIKVYLKPDSTFQYHQAWQIGYYCMELESHLCDPMEEHPIWKKFVVLVEDESVSATIRRALQPVKRIARPADIHPWQ